MTESGFCEPCPATRIKYDEILSSLEHPGDDAISALRKGLRKRKPPVFLCDGAEHPHLGHWALSDDEEPLCSWQISGKPAQAFSHSDLCARPELERHRYEFGMFVAACLKHDAGLLRHIYGDALEVLNHQARMISSARNFRHWAIVPAGHMLLA